MNLPSWRMESYDCSVHPDENNAGASGTKTMLKVAKSSDICRGADTVPSLASCTITMYAASKGEGKEIPIVPTNYDVVFGPDGSFPLEYVGNNRFCVDVDIHKERYSAARKDEKKKIVLSVVDTIQKSGGRFLQVEPSSGQIYEMQEARRLRDRVSEALREAVRDLGLKSPPAAASAAAEMESKLKNSSKPTADPATVSRLLMVQMKIREEMEKEANLTGNDSDDDDDSSAGE